MSGDLLQVPLARPPPAPPRPNSHPEAPHPPAPGNGNVPPVVLLVRSLALHVGSSTLRSGFLPASHCAA